MFRNPLPPGVPNPAIPAMPRIPGLPGVVGSTLGDLKSAISKFGASNNPFFTGRFLLRVDGMQGSVLGAFSEVNGLSVTVEVEDLVEGGENQSVHRLPKSLKWTNVTLTRGVTVGNELFTWLTECSGHGLQARGKVIRREAAISVVNSLYVPIRTWVLHEAYPVKWTGPTLTAKSRDVALESVELVHHGLSVQ